MFVPYDISANSGTVNYYSTPQEDNYIASNWKTLKYTASSEQPNQIPNDGTLWYNQTLDQVDLMIHNGTTWVGYLNYNQTLNGTSPTTDPAGPIVSATQPTVQSDGTALANGDLWIDTSDLENYPSLYRWQQVDGADQWVSVDTADQTTQNGILFADARWSATGATNPVTDPIPPISSGTTPLITSDYVDLDAPDPSLFPEGMLLFNTRRSGYNVKQFTTGYFTASNYPDAGSYNPGDPTNDANLPEFSYTWVSASGNDAQGVAYLGRKAQRNVIVEKLVAAVSNSVEATEETRNFNLMVAPGYPELTSTLNQLNVNRKETAFVLVDSPLRLASDSNTLDTWSRNLNLATDDGEAGFVSYYEYMAGYYPSGYSRDLDGNNAVVPASHMVLRSIIRSDQKSYPWFAPAGLRRGTVDNATAIGYIDGQTGEFQSIGVGNNLRDVLYNGKVNPISVLTGSGITIYGQKTRSATTSALDRVNVARLVVYLRRQLDLIARQYIFEPNDEITRKEIKNQIEKELNSIKVNRGLYDYAVVCDLSNNTPDRIDRNELWVDIAIEPVKAVEFIYIPLRIKNTGEIAAGTSTVAVSG